jgi:radical SAM protein
MASMKPLLDFSVSPMVAIWEVTRACDLACVHCRASAMPCSDPRQLSTAASLDLIEQFRELNPGVLVLTGGDPLKRPDLFLLIEAAVAAGLTVAITPSVTPLLTAGAIERLAAVGISRIALSLDGPDAATHDAFRGSPGAFAATQAAIAAVRAVDLPLQINTSLTRRTVGTIEATGRVISAIKPSLWSVFFVVPVGRAAAEQQVDAATCERVYDYLLDWSESTGLAVKTTAAQAYRRVVLQREKERVHAGLPRRPRPPAVNDGKGFVFVSHTGEVYPSGFLPLSAGNVRDRHLWAIYRDSPLFLALRDAARLEGKCGRCEFRTVCGGSRARAFAVTGNVYGEDPTCVYEPESITRRRACRGDFARPASPE